MKITEVSVSGLFGLFEHTVPLTNDTPITIIHGPNGVGKTALLRLFAAFLECDDRIFQATPFERFTVKLEDGRSVVLEKPLESISGRSFSVIAVDQYGTRREIESIGLKTSIPSSVLDAIDSYVPAPFHRYANGWRAAHSSRVLGLKDILEQYPDVSNRVPIKYRATALSQIGQELGIALNVFFVETTRLAPESKSADGAPEWVHNPFEDEDLPASMSPHSGRHQMSRVDQYSVDIKKRIRSTLADYGKNSQESDRTYPERLVRFLRESSKALTEREILEKMTELEHKRQRLISLGFLDSESGLRDLSEDDVRRAPEALTIYVNDVEQKMAVFDELAQRLGRLTDIINDRFSYKLLTFHREDGFKFESIRGVPISLKDLSSGEQHELVVLYELLFRAPKNGIVLIDEPEISLHAGWQIKFLDDLVEILKLIGCYAVIATHSPLIIGSRWDLTRELSGPDFSTADL